MSKAKRIDASTVEYFGQLIHRAADGLYRIDDGNAAHYGLNLVGAKSVILARVHKERHREKWGTVGDYEMVYLSEVGKAHWLKSGLWRTLCGEGPRQDWLRILPMELGGCTMCKSCLSIFKKRVF